MNCSGLSPVAYQLERESGLELDDCIKKEKTHELSNLINDVRNADCQIVLDWIEENRFKLRNNGQLLEWKIKRLKFCQALTSNPIPPLPKLSMFWGKNYIENLFFPSWNWSKSVNMLCKKLWKRIKIVNDGDFVSF